VSRIVGWESFHAAENAPRNPTRTFRQLTESLRLGESSQPHSGPKGRCVLFDFLRKFGAGEGIRTEPNLGKAMPV